MDDERAPRIKTDFWMKPIPLRQFDWSAWDDRIGEDSPTGYGATEQEAIDDLMEQIDGTPVSALSRTEGAHRRRAPKARSLNHSHLKGELKWDEKSEWFRQIGNTL